MLVIDNDSYSDLEYYDKNFLNSKNCEHESFSEYLERNLKDYDDPMWGLADLARDSCLKNQEYFYEFPIDNLVPFKVIDDFILKYLPKKEYGYILGDFLIYIYFEYARKYKTQYFIEHLDTLDGVEKNF